jgi:hypothetical protein
MYPPGDMGNDLFPEREERLPVGILILVEMERRDPEGIVPFRADFILGDTFEIRPDLEHQDMEMQQLALLHAVTFRREFLMGYRISGLPGTGCRTG